LMSTDSCADVHLKLTKLARAQSPLHSWLTETWNKDGFAVRGQREMNNPYCERHNKA
jgi:hypothetical protein